MIDHDKFKQLWLLSYGHFFTANCGPPSPHPNGHIIPYTSTIEGVKVTYVCWTVDQTQYQPVCKQTNVTAVRTDEGNWEPNSNSICDGSSGNNNTSA